jgi:hypothetical protein
VTKEVDRLKVYFQESPADDVYEHVVAWCDSNDLQEFGDRVFNRYADRREMVFWHTPHMYRGWHSGESRVKVMCRARFLVTREKLPVAGDAFVKQVVLELAPSAVKEAQRKYFPNGGIGGQVSG